MHEMNPAHTSVHHLDAATGAWAGLEEQSVTVSPVIFTLLGSMALKLVFLYLQYPVGYPFILGINIFELSVFFLVIFSKYKNISTKILPAILVISCFLYTSGPTVFYIFAPKFALFYNNTQILSSIFNSVFFSVFTFLILLIFSPDFCRKLTLNFDYDISIIDDSQVRGIICTVLASIIALYYVNNFYDSGIADSISTSSRFEITKKVETGRIWLIQYTMSAYTMWFTIYFYKIKSKIDPIYLAIISLNILILFIYFYYYIQLGNRREITSVAIFVFSIYFIINNKINYIFVFLVPAALIYIGVSRVMIGGVSSLSFDDAMFAALGEFVLTSFPLNIYIEMGMTDFEYGSTVIQSLLAGTPLIDLNSKPLSLANEFVQLFSFNGIGYGFSPMAEGFLNFGFLGSMFGALMLIVTIALVARFKIPLKSFSAILTCALALDIFRGESGSLFWQFCLIYLVFCLLSVAIRMPSLIRAD